MTPSLAASLFEARQVEATHAPIMVTAATTLKPHERRVLVTLPGASTYVITLPPVSDCYGLYSITVWVDGAGTATVADSDEGPVDYTSDAMTALGDGVVLFCDGLRWWQLAELTT